MSVKKELVNGIFYIALSKYVGVAVNLLITAILARLLTPADFGVIAIATVFITFFDMLSDMGIGPAVIQNKELSNKDLSSIYTLTMYIGGILTVIFYILSDALASFYQNPLLINIMQIFSISILFHCLDIVPKSLLAKDKKFAFIAFRALIIHTICGIMAIIAAYKGLGVYSLLINPVLSPVLIYVVDITKHPLKFTLAIQLKSIKKIFYYSTYQFLHSFVNYFSRNLDKLVVGKAFSVAELGYYEKSYRLMMLPVGNLSHVITPAIQPIFSQFQHDKQLQYQRTLKIFRFLSLISFPLSAFLYFSSEEIILLFFGNQWFGAIEVFKILSLSVGFQIIYSPQGAFFQSANAVKEMFYCGLFTASLNIISVILGCYYFNSLAVLCWLVVVSYVLAMIITYYIMIERVFRNRFTSFLSLFKTPLLLSFCIAILCYVTSFIIVEYSLIIRLIIKTMMFLLVMGIYEIKYKTILSSLKK